jgi:hypothetical protein
VLRERVEWLDIASFRRQQMTFRIKKFRATHNISNSSLLNRLQALNNSIQDDKFYPAVDDPKSPCEIFKNKNVNIPCPAILPHSCIFAQQFPLMGIFAV